MAISCLRADCAPRARTRRRILIPQVKTGRKVAEASESPLAWFRGLWPIADFRETVANRERKDTVAGGEKQALC